MKFYTRLREIVGKDEERLTLKEGSDVGEALRILSERYGEPLVNHIFDEKSRELAPHLQVIVDGKSAVTMKEAHTKLRDGAVVAIVPLVSGG